MSDEDKNAADDANGKEKEEDVEKDDSNLGNGEEDDQNDDGAQDDAGNDDEDSKPVTVKDLKEFQKQTLDTINQRFTSRRHNQKGSKDYPNTRKADEKDPINSRMDRIEQINAKRDFGYEHKLSPQEVDMVYKFDPKPTKKTLENPFIKGGLERMRAGSDAGENIPRGSSVRSFKVDGKDWNKLTPAEKQANFATRKEAIRAEQKK